MSTAGSHMCQSMKAGMQFVRVAVLGAMVLAPLSALGAAAIDAPDGVSGDVWADMSGQAGIRVYDETTTFTSFVIYQ